MAVTISGNTMKKLKIPTAGGVFRLLAAALAL
jgi:hypothetical protein